MSVFPAVPCAAIHARVTRRGTGRMHTIEMVRCSKCGSVYRSDRQGALPRRVRACVHPSLRARLAPPCPAPPPAPYIHQCKDGRTRVPETFGASIGSVSEPHSAEIDECHSHPGEVVVLKGGAVRWSCCHALGYQNSKFHSESVERSARPPAPPLPTQHPSPVPPHTHQCTLRPAGAFRCGCACGRMDVCMA